MDPETSFAAYMRWQFAVASFYAECEGISTLAAVEVIAPDFARVYQRAA
jgi:hypothetical protein